MDAGGCASLLAESDRKVVTTEIEMEDSMKGIDWKRKLTSRKFWAAVVGFATPLMTMMQVSENTAVQVVALIMSGGALIAYIVGEGMADAANTGAQEGEK